MAEIALTNGQIAYVDDDDYELVSRYRWFAQKERYTAYAQSTTKINGRQPLMHALLLNPPAGLVVHHDDGNGLNNRRSNLFAVTRSFNARHQVNRVPKNGYLGVFWDKRDRKWRACISRGSKRIFLGSFAVRESAAQARADYLANEAMGAQPTTV